VSTYSTVSYEKAGTPRTVVDIFGPYLPNILSELDTLRKTAYSREFLEEIQSERLKQIITLAKKDVPFYRKRLANLSRFEHFPLVTRDLLRGEPTEHFVADHFDPKRCVKSSTSGTSGKVITVLNDSSRFVSSIASLMRRLDRVGLSFGFRLAEIARTDAAVLPSWDEKFNFLTGMSRLFRLNLSTSEMEESLTSLHYFDPEVLWGYTSNLIRLGTLVEEYHISLRPKVVYPFGEKLTENARRFLGRVFSAPVHDAYGLMEAGLVAWQCENLSYHLDEERVLVELVQPDQPSQRGERQVVLTTLTNKVMPFLRYATGDYAIESKSSCDCGMKLRTVKVQGRTRELFFDQDDKPLEWDRLEHYLNSLDVYTWQVIQPENGHVHINLASDDVNTAQVEQEVRNLLINMKKIIISRSPIEELQTVVGKMPVVLGKGDQISDDLCSCLQYR